MAWEWSHSPEAYDDLRTTIARQSRDWLEETYAEWKAKPGGHFHPRSHSVTTADFDERRFERARAAARYPDSDTLAERIYNLAERQALCTNGGWEAWCCPYGCPLHTLAWKSLSDGTPVPDDYEACHECGFDHEYEPEESTRAHGRNPSQFHRDDTEDFARRA